MPQPIKELEELEKEIKDKAEPKIEHKIGELKCYWCDKLNHESSGLPVNPFISDDHYYFCIHHKTVFCDRCAHNFRHGDIKYKDAPKCPHNIPHIDCICEKRIIKTEFVDN